MPAWRCTRCALGIQRAMVHAFCLSQHVLLAMSAMEWCVWQDMKGQ